MYCDRHDGPILWGNRIRLGRPRAQQEAQRNADEDEPKAGYGLDEMILPLLATPSIRHRI